MQSTESDIMSNLKIGESVRHSKTNQAQYIIIPFNSSLHVVGVMASEKGKKTENVIL